ncbi:MAG: DegQ family serine endoprotease [Betaproteobacteria bacterium]|nr:DegQ family serine endoprotease [Betaproteobacteria bacterium]
MNMSVDKSPAALLGAAFAVLWLGLVPAANAQRSLPDFTELYEKQAATVVSIETKQKVKRGTGFTVPPGIDENDPFYDFFRRFGPRGQQRDRDIEIPGSGSGFIFSGDGYIITNHHVVEDADEVRVLLSDKREFKAKVIGSDKRTDTALIKIEATGLPRAAIGDPNKLKVGEWVVAIGQPFGLESTMTAGILSAKQRDIGGTDLVPFLQSDVAINPGNSGGPLFNMRGEVIGINSMIFSRSGGYQGVAFSIPIDVAMHVVDQLRDSGKVRRGRIGVSIGPVDKDKAEAFGLPKAQGALVNEVVKGAPAEKAGIEAGDIILKFEGRPVEKSSDLPRIVTQIKPGTKSTAQVWRKGATRDITVVVEEMKDDDQPKSDRRGSRGKDKEPADKANRLGLIVAPLSEDDKKELKLKGGLKVEQNVGSSRNLQEGDVILALVIRGTVTELKSVDQLNQLLAKMETGTNVTLQIRRGENTAFLSMRVAE